MTLSAHESTGSKADLKKKGLRRREVVSSRCIKFKSRPEKEGIKTQYPLLPFLALRSKADLKKKGLRLRQII